MEQKQPKFSLQCDMTLDGNFGQMILTLENGKLVMRDGDQTVYALSIADVRDAKLVSSVGCGHLECKYKNEDFLLARCTTRRLKSAGEFIKALTYHCKTGEYIDFEDEQTGACPKCGRPYLAGSTTCIYCAKKSTVLLRSIRMMKPFAKKFFLSCVFIALSNALYAALPALNQILIDDYLQLKTGTAASILLIAGGMILVRALCELCFMIGSRFSNYAGSYFADRLRHMVYEKIQRLSMTGLSRKTTGDLLKRITQDTQRVREFIIDQGRYLFEMIVQLVVIFVIIFTTEPLLTLMILAPVPFALWISTLIWDKLMRKYDRQWRAFSRSNSILHDIIKGIRVVKAFGNEKHEIKKFAGSCEKHAQISMENERLYVFFQLLTFFIGIGEYFMLYYGSEMVLGHTLTLGELVKFTMYIAYIYPPLRWLTRMPRWLADFMTSLLKIFEVLDEDSEIKDADQPLRPKIKGEIEFCNVTFGYKSYEPVLKDVSFRINPGEMIGLVGPSGTGKSTLINLVMRLYDVNSGAILLDGHDLREIAQNTLHENMGVVFQDNFLFAGSIYENLIYAKPDATLAEVIEAAKVANAHSFIMKLPDGYNTSVGENGYTLSGGERQRIAIARAILRDPALLILDEATASLDVETENQIQQALSRLVKNRTTIAIAHRLSTLKDANRILVLEDGRVAEFGTHKELLSKKGVYYRLVMAQLQTQAVRKED